MEANEKCINYKDKDPCNKDERCSWASGKKRSFCRTINRSRKKYDKPRGKRCPNGTRRNKDGDCVRIDKTRKN